MFKRAVIYLTFLAYALMLVHSLVPHQHHKEADTHRHHQHDSEKHHHHDDTSDDEGSLGHAFSDAIHHPASEIVIHTAQSENIGKTSKGADIYIVNQKVLLSPQLKPPDIKPYYPKRHYTSDHPSFFFLRAPPVA